ncbi:MAG: pitrilysin family protein [Burkholderiales bacterium]
MNARNVLMPNDFRGDTDTSVATLANGVRVVAIELPHLASACVSVFVRTGSRHESARDNGISHVIEHMAFKGTQSRSCQQVNLDAERLGAEVNAHTDKDHTAYHMRGLARHAGQFIEMLGDIVQHSTFPADELERERQVILHEFADDEEDALAIASRLFDKLAFGTHPLARPVIGSRRNIERFTRDDLLGYVQRQYSGANVIVGIAGAIDPMRMLQAVQDAFGAMPRGSEHEVSKPDPAGGVRTHRQAGCSQTHMVLGFPIATLCENYVAGIVAAALFGEGMSSPLMDELRERRGLVYYASCSAEVMDVSGQFVIEASTSPAQLDELLDATMRLLAEHAERIDRVGLERARNQIAVRNLGAQERPFRRIEDAAQDLFAFGRVRARVELAASIEAVTAQQVRAVFRRMLAAPAALAVAGSLRPGARGRLTARMARRNP